MLYYKNILDFKITPKEVEDMFRDFWDTLPYKATKEGSEYVLRFNVPGENKNTIKVSFDKNILLITIRDSKPYSVVMNTESINLDSCVAKCEDGVLTLKFKELEKSKTKTITVE